MKRPKDRLHNVIVIGATPAGIAATNKLGELGIPVTLVDCDPDLDQKLARDEWRLQSGVPLNFAHRSGLIRIMRNPAIQCIMPAKITSISHNPKGFLMRVSKQPTFVDPDKCILCGRCVEICPVSVDDGGKAVRLNSRRSLPGRPVIDKRRQPLCQAECPLGVNAPGYIALAKNGRYIEALNLIRENNILPGICGRICTHPCERACRRGELDEPIAIMDIKRFVADYELSHTFEIKPPEVLDSINRAEKVAVIGSGPAGLAAAADLARYGYDVTVFEKEKMAGGLLRYGIGPYRLPREILDLELKYIEKLGVKFITAHRVDLAQDLDRLKKDFDAVILSTGVWHDRRLGVPGEELKEVEGCLHFLTRLYRGEIKELKEKVAVIGDGNAAFDLARTLVRLGADVTLLSWFSENLIPADPEEVRAAKEEGVSIKDETQIVAFIDQNGRLDRLRCRPTEPGEPDAAGIPWPVIIPDREPFELEFDRAFVAIGQRGESRADRNKVEFGISGPGFVEVDDSMRTKAQRVYAAGDAVVGPSSVVEAMAAGRKVARTVHSDLAGQQDIHIRSLRPKDKDYPEIPTDIPSQTRPARPERQLGSRKQGFEEVALGLTEPQIVFETERCLQCGVCSECFQCVDACAAIGAIKHSESPEEIIQHAGVIIIADPEMAPQIKGEDVIRAYGPKSAKADVYAMFLRGFAAAAQAMILLSGASQRPKGHGISFFPPDPGLSSEVRLGIFVCRCNDALGWLDGMNDYIDRLRSRQDVVHAEVVSAACVPEGTSGILRTIREKGITRGVIASCVCCPLDFVCSACTDQRSRLKDALFKGTGVSRSMIEMCNLRGEVLNFLKHDPALAIARFTGLIDRSMRRAKKLKPFPAPARNYNFTTAVIGESEEITSSALTLAEAGLDVFMLGTSEKPLTKTVDHPNVHCFEGSAAKELRGSLGDFQVLVEMGGFQQSLEAGAVIMGERSRKNIQYLHIEGLPSRIVASSMQAEGVTGIPFLYPGSTSISGLYLVDPPHINVSNRKKGAAAAVLAAAIMPRVPRQSKGYTVEVQEDRCRGCGRCVRACSYLAIELLRNSIGGWCASVDEALCKGCGNCISVCPSGAADSPYRDQAFLEQSLVEILGSQKSL